MVLVDLVDNGLVVMAPVPLNFIDADGLDVIEVAVLQSPGNSVFHSFVDMLPTNTESGGNLFPRHATRPKGKEPFVLGGQGTLAFCPRNTLDLDAAGRAFHPSHVVNEIHHDSPQWNKLEPSWFWHGVVTGTQCDGVRSQCIVLARDDFWLPCYRFFEDLDTDLQQAVNFSVVDKFDQVHADRVLRAFGRSLGSLPERSSEDSAEQDAFVEQALEELVDQDNRVICIQLALFGEMVKGMPWCPATMKEVGGTAGVGAVFLERSLSAPSANPRHRRYQKEARAVLSALLPELGSDLRGNMKSREQLLALSGLATQPDAFDEVIQILDSDLRLVTPTDPEGHTNSLDREADAEPVSRYYQLTHDYLVPSLRQ